MEVKKMGSVKETFKVERDSWEVEPFVSTRKTRELRMGIGAGALFGSGISACSLLLAPCESLTFRLNLSKFD
ncbi:hypothetical protein QQP08_014133 [Theobroma cacao]|nr:hypothetical protein QQP08_013805 [Theobroma cacao]WRX21646.1 hypothetical protein QQP08_014133 [Theobroma cacao]